MKGPTVSPRRFWNRRRISRSFASRNPQSRPFVWARGAETSLHRRPKSSRFRRPLTPPKQAGPRGRSSGSPPTAITFAGPIRSFRRNSSTPALTLSKASNSRSSGGVQGDGPGNSFVYIPSLKAVVAGVSAVFDQRLFRSAQSRSPRRLDEDAGSDSRVEAGHCNSPAIAWPGC